MTEFTEENIQQIETWLERPTASKQASCPWATDFASLACYAIPRNLLLVPSQQEIRDRCITIFPSLEKKTTAAKRTFCCPCPLYGLKYVTKRVRKFVKEYKK